MYDGREENSNLRNEMKKYRRRKKTRRSKKV